MATVRNVVIVRTGKAAVMGVAKADKARMPVARDATTVAKAVVKASSVPTATVRHAPTVTARVPVVKAAPRSQRLPALKETPLTPAPSAPPVAIARASVVKAAGNAENAARAVASVVKVAVMDAAIVVHAPRMASPQHLRPPHWHRPQSPRVPWRLRE